MSMCHCGHSTEQGKHPKWGACGAYRCGCQRFEELGSVLPDTIGTIVPGIVVPHPSNWQRRRDPDDIIPATHTARMTHGDAV